MPKECVQVCIRCRPLSKTEKKDKRSICVNFDKPTGQIKVKNKENASKNKTFTYDRIFPIGTSQKDLYDEAAAPIIESVLQGYNGTIFAYGQTGTGKTYTMEGPDDVSDPADKGINPRAFKHIFDHIDASEDIKYLVHVSFIQIYQDQVMDLLGSNPDQKLKVKRKDTGFYVDKLSTFVVQDAKEIDRLLQEGKKNRKTGATAMNDRSSRSHCVFTVVVECSELGEDGQEHIRMGKLNLVDLAGSEKQAKTNATGQRLKEAAKINLSLSALGNVISALVVKKKNKHIPYYDSKLTRLLMDSLGGNTKTAMIANIGPAGYNFDETVTTLRFADRAKNIKNKPKINEDPKDAMMRDFQDKIEQLKQQLAMVEAMGEDGQIPEELMATMAGGGGGRLPAKRVIIEKVVEKVVKVGASKEELEEMEREAEERKIEMQARAAEEKAEILAAAEGHQQRVAELKSKVLTKKELAEKKRVAKAELAEKLAAVNAKIVMGNQLMDEQAKNRVLLQKKKARLAEDERRKAELARRVQEKEAKQMDLNQKFDNQEKAIAGKTKQLDKLRGLFKEIKQEIEDMSDENEKEREDLLQTIRDLTKHVQLKQVIISHFVPHHVQEQIHQRAQFDQERDEWFLKPYKTADIKVEAAPVSARPGFNRPITEFSRVRQALGDRNPRFAVDNTIQLELDMPDRTTRDYEELLDEFRDDQHEHPQHQQQQQYEDDPYEDQYDPHFQQQAHSTPYMQEQYGGRPEEGADYNYHYE